MIHPTNQSSLVYGTTRQRTYEDLGHCVVGIRAWMLEVDQFGIPRFGETATRLRPLRDWLDRQFQHEDKIKDSCIDGPDDSSLMFDGSQQPPGWKPMADRLDDLIRRLNQTEPSFRSWQEAMDEVECFLDALPGHEESSAENIAIL